MAIPKGTPLDGLLNSLRLDEPGDRQGGSAFDIVREGMAVVSFPFQKETFTGPFKIRVSKYVSGIAPSKKSVG